MAFTQIIELDGVSDEQSLHHHVARWDAGQAGIAPGYLGARVFVDEESRGRYLVEVDFASAEEAEKNNHREETSAWAAELRGLASGDLGYRNLRQVCTTYP